MVTHQHILEFSENGPLGSSFSSKHPVSSYFKSEAVLDTQQGWGPTDLLHKLGSALLPSEAAPGRHLTETEGAERGGRRLELSRVAIRDVLQGLWVPSTAGGFLLGTEAPSSLGAGSEQRSCGIL